ncbi:hypothetical protein ANCCAN_18537 [Ancylostoma caninum]|uniref:Uncharacterized protein n=1 Tax=Ancylostoma caninum TaxID=29170 RepID=A0A368FVU9_ANCCA|nr:hypothetical protein ANCCAN_18537 [Ancylostoma caninum]
MLQRMRFFRVVLRRRSAADCLPAEHLGVPSLYLPGCFYRCRDSRALSAVLHHKLVRRSKTNLACRPNHRRRNDEAESEECSSVCLGIRYSGGVRAAHSSSSEASHVQRCQIVCLTR